MRRGVFGRAGSTPAAIAASLLCFVATLWAAPAPKPERTGAPGGRQETDEKKVLELIRLLGSDDIGERERASEDLKKMGSKILPALRAGLEKAGDAETRARLSALIDYLSRPHLEPEAQFDVESENNEWDMAWSPDGNWMALAGGKDDALIQLRETGTWKTVAEARLPKNESVDDLIFSPDSGLLAVQHTHSGTGGQRLSFYDARTLRRRFMLKTGTKAAGLFFLDNDRVAFLAAREEDADAGKAIWIAERKKDEWAAEEKRSCPVPAGRFALDPARERLAVMHGKGVDTWDVKTWKKSASVTLSQHVEFPLLRFSADGKLLAVRQGSKHSTVSVLDASTLKEIKAWDPNGGSGNAVDFDFVDGSRYLATVGGDKTVRVWRCGDWAEAASAALPGPCSELLASPSGDRVVIRRSDEPKGGSGSYEYRCIQVFRLRGP